MTEVGIVGSASEQSIPNILLAMDFEEMDIEVLLCLN